ncbi:Lrp/AsnC family transcriptional regulator [Umezawaea endophytica]|uniref:Lrp/AsnC family transcriptional regulator n=1 Tax=Umezawaea endophytica TaxID=1654476 RepID=A0A9X3A0M2_9PSEU|nr:Lrp/AsnC family transcriptional regulator [Umezawaea endophytica]MCS7477148.1 Lrp/AsnC family transcriptional regulator [Umezawaea endophytica]
MEGADFDELDIAIVDAVRSVPRVSWRDLAPVMGVNAATISRRWSRMQAAGVVWVTAHPAGNATPTCALVEINCAPGESTAVAEALAGDVEAATVKLTSGARDVQVLAQVPDLAALSGYLSDRVGRTPGVVSVRGHIVTRSAFEASRWREGALDLDQQRRLGAHDTTRGEHDGVLDSADHRLLRALTIDGRMSLERLSEHVGLGAVTVRRRLSRLESAGLVIYRCDTSKHLSGRAFAATYYGSIDVNDLDAAEERLRGLPGVRACSIVAGPHNVIIDAWLHTAAEVHELERRMSRALPALRIKDRAVVLRLVKLLGRILDAEGRSVRSVPLLKDDAP